MNSKKKSLHVKVNSDTFEMVEQYRKNRKLNRSVAVERLLFLAGTISANIEPDETLENEVKRAREVSLLDIVKLSREKGAETDTE